jgi:serine/threonine protein kinase
MISTNLPEMASIDVIRNSIAQCSKQTCLEHEIETLRKAAMNGLSSAAQVIKMQPRSLLVGEGQAYLLMTRCKKQQDQPIFTSPPKSVKKAITLLTGEVVAVVIIKQHARSHPIKYEKTLFDHALATFQTELETHRSCVSIKGVAQLFLHCVTRDKNGTTKVMQVMEYCQGESPHWGYQLVESPKDLESLCSFLKIIRTIHQKGLFHGDPHPGNVILTPKGPRLIDFGVVVSEKQEDARLTDLRTILDHHLSPFFQGLLSLHNSEEIRQRTERILQETRRAIDRLSDVSMSSENLTSQIVSMSDTLIKNLKELHPAWPPEREPEQSTTREPNDQTPQTREPPPTLYGVRLRF